MDKPFCQSNHFLFENYSHNLAVLCYNANISYKGGRFKMENMLWTQFKTWQENCKWVDLTYPLSPTTPHWVGWNALAVETTASLGDDSIFAANTYTTVGQYGTHVDAPTHMVKDGRSLDQITPAEMVLPLCVIDKSQAAKENADYILSVEDILVWEQTHGKIPAGSFVAFRTDWCKRPATDMDNLDGEGNRHFPGWGLETLKFLVEQRNIGGIGHETSDTEAPITSGKTNYEVEYYILEQDKMHIELLKDLDQCPATGALIFCTFPSVVGGTGFPARCFALMPK